MWPASSPTANFGSRPWGSPTVRPRRTRPAEMAELLRRVAGRGRLGLLDRPRVRSGVRRARGGGHRSLPRARAERRALRHPHAPPRRGRRRLRRRGDPGRAGRAVRLQVSHLVPRNGIEEARRSIGLVEGARGTGLDVEFDMHTRLYGLTHLYAALPPVGPGREPCAARRDCSRPRGPRPDAPPR